MMFKALTGCLISILLFIVFYNGDFMLQLTESGLQLTIDYLNNIQSYVGEKRIEIMNKELKEDNRQRKVFSTRNEEICPPYSYRTRIVNRNPLIIYIENILTQKEINHLIELADPLFKPSTTYNEDGSQTFSDYRTSHSAYIYRHQTHIVRCIERKYAHFQGNIDVDRLEPFQIVKYTDNQQYKAHFDWLDDEDIIRDGGQRVSTFFTYLQSNCSMGETEFFNVPFNQSLHQQFCDILVCDKKSSKHGIRFRPIPGNSVFWYNVDEYGQVDQLTHHAGLPPGPNGHKIGLNAWTREQKFRGKPIKNQKDN